MFEFPATKTLFYICRNNLACSSLLKRSFKFSSGNIVQPNQVCGIYYLKDGRLNKGMAFDLQERQHLTIQGLLPPRTRTLDEQLKLCMYSFSHFKSPLDRYMYLNDLNERNVTLYFGLINKYVEQIMPIVYTPTVGTVCQNFGSLFRNPNGIFVTYHDKGNIKHILKNWPESQVRAVCVTDGERILGLGDLGANGMGICIGKLTLYTALGRVKPHMLLPIMLDVGTDNESLLNSPFYLGLRMKRVRGKEYDDFLDEFMEAVVNQYGSSTLIHFEDFAYNNALHLLTKYSPKYCVFNDDIQGTGAIGLSGIYAAGVVLQKNIKEFKYLFVGAGGANMGIASTLVTALTNEGLTCDEAFDRIFVTDLDGLITVHREKFTPLVECFAKDQEPMKDLLEIVKTVKPNVLCGATASAGLFSAEILKVMSEINERPIIFALSNPTSVSECSAEQAITNTGGRALFCSGSPMPPVEYDGKVLQTSQINNAFIFPGVALGILVSKSYHCNEDMFILAAKEVAKYASEEKANCGALLPTLQLANEISTKIAVRIADYAFETGLAAKYPRPIDTEQFVIDCLYSFDYVSALAPQWSWPKMPEVHIEDANIESLPKY